MATARNALSSKSRKGRSGRAVAFVRKLVAIETNVPAREIFRLRGHDRCV